MTDPAMESNKDGKGPAAEGEEPVTLEAAAEAGEERPARDVRQEHLLDRLLYSGVLPRYAFPTDVATFYVFDVPKSTRYRPAFRFTPSQGLSIALSQYAPGKEVWIANKRFSCGAIYSPFYGDRVEAWQRRRLYYECAQCHFADTQERSEGHRGESLRCPACGSDSFGPAMYWLRPVGFAHPCDVADGVTPDDQPATSYATRAKLTAPTRPTAAEWVRVNPRLQTRYLRDRLLVTNSGPRGEGYTYCTRCGRIEPTASAGAKLYSQHNKPYPDDVLCPGDRTAAGVCLGTDFVTDVLLVSFRMEPPLHLMPGRSATEIGLRTLSEAVARAACTVLDLEEGEIQADFRAALTPEGQHGLEAEIYLYDTLPGGAGFSRRAGERFPEVLSTALDALVRCDCDASCYKCLRSFKNKFEHHRLDRHLGADLLRFILRGDVPSLSEERTRLAVELVAEDVLRQATPHVSVGTWKKVNIEGIGDVLAPILAERDGRAYLICVAHPLSAGTPPTPELLDVAELTTTPVICINELLVRKSLPIATKTVLEQLGLAG